MKMPSKTRMDMLRALLEVDELQKLISVHGSPAKYVDFFIENDKLKIVLYGASPRWYARLIRRTEETELTMFLINIINAVTGIGGTKNDNLYYALCIDTIQKTVNNHDFDAAIDSVIDTIRYGSKGILASRYLQIDPVHNSRIDVNINTIRNADGKVVLYARLPHSNEVISIPARYTSLIDLSEGLYHKVRLSEGIKNDYLKGRRGVYRSNMLFKPEDEGSFGLPECLGIGLPEVRFLRHSLSTFLCCPIKK